MPKKTNVTIRSLTSSSFVSSMILVGILMIGFAASNNSISSSIGVVVEAFVITTSSSTTRLIGRKNGRSRSSSSLSYYYNFDVKQQAIIQRTSTHLSLIQRRRQHQQDHPVVTSTSTTRLYYVVKNETDITLPMESGYTNNNVIHNKQHVPRFAKTADTKPELDVPCILTIDNVRYNLTAWAKAHPGGVKILQKFHDKDASKAFHSAGHSKVAYAMLKDFEIKKNDNEDDNNNNKDNNNSNNNNAVGAAVIKSSTPTVVVSAATAVSSSVTKMEQEQQQTSMSVLPAHTVPRWRIKLFTKEDPIGIHKYLGVFSLLHFLFRYGQMFFGDPSAGLGSRLGKGPSWIPVLCLLPHGILSVSSLIFHTVPKERVVGKPMIWQEYRAHNIIFGLRSVITAIICSLCIHFGNTPSIRKIGIVSSCATCITAMICADYATKYLRVNNNESTTATMPYWDGCSIETQKRFKTFYAYCQFMATIGCLTVTNPAFPLAILLAIQIASLLMTLVRKGLLSARGYHLGYTASLIAPYLVAFRSTMYSKSIEMPVLFAVGSGMFMLRRMGISKYALWLPVVVTRIIFGDGFLKYAVW